MKQIEKCKQEKRISEKTTNLCRTCFEDLCFDSEIGKGLLEDKDD